MLKITHATMIAALMACNVAYAQTPQSPGNAVGGATGAAGGPGSVDAGSGPTGGSSTHPSQTLNGNVENSQTSTEPSCEQPKENREASKQAPAKEANCSR